MKKKIMVDMDDVMCGGGFLGLINEFLGTNYTEEDVEGYYMQNLMPEDKRELFLDYLLQKNFYDYCHIYPHSQKVLKELQEEYEVFIGTAYILAKREKESGVILLNKYNFLQEHFPFINPENYVFVCNKEILSCYAKIDDRLENLKRAKRKLLYTAYHNKDLESDYLENQGIERVDNWLEVKSKLLKKTF